MNRLCIDCPGRLTGDCVECDANDDPRGGDYDEDAFADEGPEPDRDGGKE